MQARDSLFLPEEEPVHGPKMKAKGNSTPIASISVLSQIERVNLTTFVGERIHQAVTDPNSLNKTAGVVARHSITGTIQSSPDPVLTWEDAVVIMNDYLKKYMGIHKLTILTKKRNPQNRLFQLHIKTHTRAINDIRTLIYDELEGVLMNACAERHTAIAAEKERIKKEAADAELAIIRNIREARKLEAQQQKEAEEQRAKEQEQTDLIDRLKSIVADLGIADDEWD